MGFDEARAIALERLIDETLAGRIAGALRGRFSEVIVDETQDCNPDDLTAISWLRDSGLPAKVVCDPHQAIYGLRAGVTDHLEDRYPPRDAEDIELHGLAEELLAQQSTTSGVTWRLAKASVAKIVSNSKENARLDSKTPRLRY